MFQGKILDINVQEPYFTFIKNGMKKVEGRLAKEKFTSLKPGDVLVINGEIKKEVERVNRYTSFREMLVHEGTEQVVPDANNLEEAVKVYYRFFTKEEEERLGVCAILLR